MPRKDYETTALEGMRPELKQLRAFLKDCRIDMHEPDEQDVSAQITGDHLDNAGCGPEFTVVLTRHGKKHSINLATLIAMARLAAL